MADADNNVDEKEVTAPLFVKKPNTPAKSETTDEKEQTLKIPKPVNLGSKPLVPPSGGDNSKPLTPPGGQAKKPNIVLPKLKPGEDDQTARIPKPAISSENKKKIILNSATDSTIKPSDVTTMAPAAVDMHKTESKNVEVANSTTPAPATAALKASTKVKGRKTIKLKPLKKEPSKEDENVQETISINRSTLSEDTKNPPPVKGDTPKPNVIKPAVANPDDTKIEEPDDDRSTVKVQRPKVSKPAHPIATALGAKEAVKLRPSTTPPPPGAEPVAVTKTEATVESSVSEKSEKSVSKKTIRLVPKEGDDKETQKTPKPNVVATKPLAASSIAVPAETPAAKPAAPAPPSAPTVKAPEPPPPPAEQKVASKKTLKLKSASSVASPPPETDDSKEEAIPPATKDTDSTIMPSPKRKEGADPGMALTLVAVLTLIAVAYYVWMVGGQWAEQYMDVESANVPALSGTVR